MANSSKNFWKRKRYPSSGIPVFRESGIGSSSEGIKGRKISVEKDGMHSKLGSRECKKNEEQALKPLFEIKKKALDGRRFKELMKFRAKGANASDHVREDKNKLFQQDGYVLEANSSSKVGELIVEIPGSSCDGKCPCRMVSHQTPETCSCDALQSHDKSAMTVVGNQDTQAEINREPTSHQDHALISECRQDVDVKCEDKSCLNCGHGGKLLCCVGQGCGRSFHLSCVNPPFTCFPPGVWHCIWCVKKKIEMGVYTVSEGIESILDAKWELADEATQKQKYLVKYKGLAHVHNCWIPEKKLLLEAPALFERYKKKKHKVRWKNQWSEPERVLAKRLLLFPKQCNGNSYEHDHCRYEWLVKWTELGYDQATWELENAPFLRTPEGIKLIHDLAIRHEKVKVEAHNAKETKRRKTSLFELSELPDHLIYVNKLRKGWQEDRNVLVIDPQERVVKVVLFVLSLLKETSGPFLIITTSASLSMWEAEFHHWASAVNVVVYKGSGDIRATIKTLEFYNEGGSIMFQVLLSPSIAVVEDLENLKPIKWEVIVVDECQRPTISVHLEQIRMLAANMRLLLVSSQIQDWNFNYVDVLSLLDPKFRGAYKDCLEADTSKLKKRLLDFIAYECQPEPVKFLEFWVPVMLTDVQIEQYCASLFSNSMVLCSHLRSDPASSFHDLLKTTRKCCDHPYLVDRSLRNLVLQGKPASDHFDIEIQMSGKLQLLNKVLPEIKRRGLRVLIMFQETEGSGKISIGDILDDFIHQKFGTDSYSRIDSEISRSKKLAAFNMFNNKDNGNFVCLIETRACLPSTKLSSVDIIIIFNSDWDPVNDLKSLQKITLNSKFEQLKIFRFYSSYTVEEKALVLAKEGVTLDSNIKNVKQSTCQKLLMWGAPCLFGKLDGYNEFNGSSSNLISLFEQTLSEDVFLELSSLLPCNSVEDGPTCDSSRKSTSKNVLMVKQSEGTYHGKNLCLIGELKSQSMDSFSIISHMIKGESPDIFWTNLLEGRNPRWKFMSSSLQRKRKVNIVTTFSEDSECEGGITKKSRREANFTSTPNEKLVTQRRFRGRGNKRKFSGKSPNSAVKKYRHGCNLARNVLVKRVKEAAITRDSDRIICCDAETATLCTVGQPTHGTLPGAELDPSPFHSALPNKLLVSTNSTPAGHEEDDISESRENQNYFFNPASASCYQGQAPAQTTIQGSTRPHAVQQAVRNLQAITTVDRSELDDANLGQENLNPDFYHTEASSGISEVPQSSCLASLQREMERLQLAREHAIKVHEDLKLQLESECAKELEEIHKKYELLLHNSELVLAQKKTYLDYCYQIVYTQKLLAEVMILNQDGVTASQSQGKPEVTLATFMSDIYGSCFSPASGRTIPGPDPSGNPSPLVASNLSAAQQAAARNSAIPEHDSMGLQTSIRSSAPSVEVGNYASTGQQTTASAILRAEIYSPNLSMLRPPPHTSDMLVVTQSPAVLQPGTMITASFTQSTDPAVSRYSESEILTGPERTSVLSTSRSRSPSIANIRLSGNRYAGREIRAPAPHLRHSLPSPLQ